MSTSAVDRSVGKAHLEAAFRRHGFESPEAFASALLAEFPNALDDSFSTEDIATATERGVSPVVRTLLETGLLCGGYGPDMSDAIARSLGTGLTSDMGLALVKSLSASRRYLG